MTAAAAKAELKAAHVPRPLRVQGVRDLLNRGVSHAKIIEWCMATFAASESAGIVAAKTWKVSLSEARRLLEDAKDANALGELQSAGRKKQERRAVYEFLLERAIKRDTVKGDELAMRINDAMCRIDGAYDPSQIPPSSPVGVNIEDAVQLIDHASSLLELARRRQALPLPPGDPIDTTATEVVDDETDDESTVTGSAN